MASKQWPSDNGSTLAGKAQEKYPHTPKKPKPLPLDTAGSGRKRPLGEVEEGSEEEDEMEYTPTKKTRDQIPEHNPRSPLNDNWHERDSQSKQQHDQTHTPSPTPGHGHGHGHSHSAPISAPFPASWGLPEPATSQTKLAGLRGARGRGHSRSHVRLESSGTAASGPVFSSSQHSRSASIQPSMTCRQGASQKSAAREGTGGSGAGQGQEQRRIDGKAGGNDVEMDG